MILVFKQLRVSNKGKHQRLLPLVFKHHLVQGLKLWFQICWMSFFTKPSPSLLSPRVLHVRPVLKIGFRLRQWQIMASIPSLNFLVKKCLSSKSMQHLIYHEVSYIHWVCFSHVFFVVRYKKWRKLYQISHKVFVFRNQFQRSMFLIFWGKHSITSNCHISPSCSFTHKGHSTSMPIHKVFWLAKKLSQRSLLLFIYIYIEWSGSNLFAWHCGLVSTMSQARIWKDYLCMVTLNNWTKSTVESITRFSRCIVFTWQRCKQLQEAVQIEKMISSESSWVQMVCSWS